MAESERKAQGKLHYKCSSREEALDYFQENIASLDIFTDSPTLGDVEGKPLTKESTSVHYSVLLTRQFTMYKDIALAYSTVELEDHWLVNFIPSMVEEKFYLRYKNMYGDFFKTFGSDQTNIDSRNK